MTFQETIELLKTSLPHVVTLLLALLAMWMQARQKKQDKVKSTTDYSMDLGAEVYKFIYTLRDRFDAQRVNVYLLHNGGTYFNGDHMKKITLQYDACKEGVPGICDDFQQRLIKGTLFRWMDALRKKTLGCLYRENRSLLVDHETKAMMAAYDVEASFSVLIRDGDNDPIAVLELSFDAIDPLSSIDRDHIYSQSIKLRSILLGKLQTLKNRTVPA